MDKLVHKSDGSLIRSNPFRTVGTKIRYTQDHSLVGVITERALVKAADDENAYPRSKGRRVWAAFGRVNIPENPEGVMPSYLSSEKVEIIDD